MQQIIEEADRRNATVAGRLWDAALREGFAKIDQAFGIKEEVKPVCNEKEGMEVFPQGGKRSKIKERFDLVPLDGLIQVAQVMAVGAEKYGETNWHGIPQESCANHAIRHLVLWLNGDDSENHAAHAAANCLMLCDLILREQRK